MANKLANTGVFTPADMEQVPVACIHLAFCLWPDEWKSVFTLLSALFCSLLWLKMKLIRVVNQNS